MVQTPQNRCGSDSPPRFARLCGEAFVESTRDTLPDTLMRSGVIVVVDQRSDEAMELVAVEDEHMVQAFPFQAADKALADRIGPRCSNQRPQFLDATTSGDSGEPPTVLVVPVVNGVLGALAPGCQFAHQVC